MRGGRQHSKVAPGSPSRLSGRDPGLPEFIEQRRIANAKRPGGRASIPKVIFQSSQNDPSFELCCGLSYHLLDVDHSPTRKVHGKFVGMGISERFDNRFFASHDNIALNDVFEFADIPRPMVFTEKRKAFGG